MRSQPGTISGALGWVALPSSLPTGAIVFLTILTVGDAIAVMLVRRRQGRSEEDDAPEPAAEA